MSRRVESLVALAAWPVACALASAGPAARAQTIADYSRAQRALLESAMSQAAARSAGLGTLAPAVAAPPAAASAPPPAPRVAMPLTMPAFAPVVQVSGVFAARDRAVAEVLVDAIPYLLGAGQQVPGTAWHVESIAIDRVVLRRPDSRSVADAPGARKAFSLPTLR